MTSNNSSTNGKESTLEVDWRCFAPDLGPAGESARRELSAAALLPPEQAVPALDAIAARFATRSSASGLAVRTAALVLRDLLRMGWEVRCKDQVIWVRPHADDDGAPTKDSIRRHLLFGRDDQLREDSHRSFIHGLERPSRYSKCLPVTHLIADGRRLASQLQDVAALPEEERAEALRERCSPYLQLVTDDRDEHTQIRLMDIWRYFRHTWATRYRSTPGRNLFYLIRDAAQPYHPVMAITALGNAVMQLTPRDMWLGWTASGLSALVKQGELSGEEAAAALRRRLRLDIDRIYVEDLPVGPGWPDDVTDDLLAKLKDVEEEARRERLVELRRAQEVAESARMEPEDAVAGATEGGDATTSPAEALLLETLSSLYRGKRARAARQLGRAYRAIPSGMPLEDLLQQPDGPWAVGQAITQLKKRFSATSMMEMIVCGAAPPYGQLLGGKLACLMMLSTKVIADVRSRYEETESIIASRMAGRPIIKGPEMVLLGTTSLYSQRSAQYNRVKLPAGTMPGQHAELRYKVLGRTEGYGSPNLSSEAEQALAELSNASRAYRNVNFKFGEGQSPKLRQLREGFASLGLDQANLLQHGAPRIIYAVALAENTRRYLLGVDEDPRYALPAVEESGAIIADYWRTRWLAARLNHQPAIDAVAQSTPMTERVSRLIPPRGPRTQLSLFPAPPDRRERTMSTQRDDRIDFIRLLYRDESAYSDKVNLSRLKELNIKTHLEDVIKKAIRAGASVVITGNAGDGKTHTIRLLKDDLKGAEVITDASELTQEEIIKRWAESRDAKRAFCIAINEGPLIDLIRSYKDSHPWLSDVRARLLGLVSYVPVEHTDDKAERWTPAADETLVIDLSLRLTLSRDLLRSIVNKLTDDAWYQSCTSCPAAGTCPVTYNREMLRRVRVQERLVDLLRRVAERGVRATFRETLSFVSFMIFGGRSCAELAGMNASETARYYWNAFEGQGLLFEQLSLGLDPLRQTSPRTDELLWGGQIVAASFEGHALYPLDAVNLDGLQESEPDRAADTFTALKRRWYFEHEDGRIGRLTKADSLFQKLQSPDLAAQLRVGRLLEIINGWWNSADKQQQDCLRIWTRLSFSPRARGAAMVSGRDVPTIRLILYRPQLAPELRAAYGEQPVDHLVLAHPDNPQVARLVVDRRLLVGLLSGDLTERSDEVERRLEQFNDVMARFAEGGSHVRTIEVIDPRSELQVRLRVDVGQRRYDSAT